MRRTAAPWIFRKIERPKAEDLLASGNRGKVDSVFGPEKLIATVRDHEHSVFITPTEVSVPSENWILLIFHVRPRNLIRYRYSVEGALDPLLVKPLVVQEPLSFDVHGPRVLDEVVIPGIRIV
jgi:hypothetical protein